MASQSFAAVIDECILILSEGPGGIPRRRKLGSVRLIPAHPPAADPGPLASPPRISACHFPGGSWKMSASNSASWNPRRCSPLISDSARSRRPSRRGG